MGWREQLRKASFRGAEFFYSSDDAGFGRRNITHEYPGRDEPFIEDVGRKARRFKIDAYVIGEDYFSKRNLLIRALEEEGPGELVHPYYGELYVSVDGEVSVQHSTKDGGMCRFSIAFVEYGADNDPFIQIDPSGELDSAADDAIEEMEDQFTDEFNTEGEDSLTVDSASSAIGSVSDTYKAASANIGAITDAIDEVSDTISEIASFAQDLAAAPGRFSAMVKKVAGKIMGPITSAKLLLRTLGVVGNHEPESQDLDNESPTQDVKNHNAIGGFVRGTAIVEAMRVAGSSEMIYTSATEAQNVNDILEEYIDEQLEIASPQVVEQLIRARTALAVAIEERVAKLGEIQSYSTREQTPTIVLAHYLYGDTLLEQDLIDRNNIRDPFLVPSETELEILAPL